MRGGGRGISSAVDNTITILLKAHRGTTPQLKERYEHLAFPGVLPRKYWSTTVLLSFGDLTRTDMCSMVSRMRVNESDLVKYLVR